MPQTNTAALLFPNHGTPGFVNRCGSAIPLSCIASRQPTILNSRSQNDDTANHVQRPCAIRGHKLAGVHTVILPNGAPRSPWPRDNPVAVVGHRSEILPHVQGISLLNMPCTSHGRTTLERSLLNWSHACGRCGLGARAQLRQAAEHRAAGICRFSPPSRMRTIV